MPRHLHKLHGADSLFPARATRAPMGGLSCPYSHLDAVPGRGRDFLATDYCKPPTSESQHARQRVLAVILAFILAAILAQAGW
jgi:hypothetical protein